VDGIAVTPTNQFRQWLNWFGGWVSPEPPLIQLGKAGRDPTAKRWSVEVWNLGMVPTEIIS